MPKVRYQVLTVTTLRGKRGGGGVSEGEVETSCQSSVSSQARRLAHPLRYLSSRGSQGMPCFPLMRQIETGGQVPSFSFPSCVAVYSSPPLLPPLTSPSPSPGVCLLCLHRPKLICIIAGLFAESQSLCMCPLPGSARDGEGGWGETSRSTVRALMEAGESEMDCQVS